MTTHKCTNCGELFTGENCCVIPDPRPVIIADSTPPRIIIGASHLPFHVLMVAAAQVLAVPTMDRLIDEALDAEGYDFVQFADRHYWPLAPGLVRVSSMEAVELGIPTRSLRGWSGSPMDHEWQWVDRRCLKRYRRKAGRRQ